MRVGQLSLSYVARKLGWAALTLFFVLTVNFFLFRVMPGDPVALLARSQRLTPEAVAEQKALYGLDQPMLQQFLTYLRQTLTGHLGSSLVSGQPVTRVIGARVWPTVLLVGSGTALAIIVGVLAGIRAGWFRGTRFDRGSLYGSMLLYSTPEGWLGMLLLIVFAGSLSWFPSGGLSSGGESGLGSVTDVLSHLALPVATLALSYVGQFLIVMRSSMLDVKDEDFVTVGRAVGLPDRLVRRRLVVPNAILPSFTLIVLSFGFVLGGAIVIETVFSWPGIGQLTYRAIESQDYPVLQAVFLLTSAAVIVANLVADIAYGFLDPRIEEV
ncbi:MAG: ABC transporter permease [Actinomycetota bacterium]|nr:ABC transporter permease [Actinomycetota bacterium]MDH4353635.1 ABC transporter permease [Actinomycetota bacterium]MDH5278385.1 ABC transporter permease [Actinomycetota bacterium]